MGQMAAGAAAVQRTENPSMRRGFSLVGSKENGTNGTCGFMNLSETSAPLDTDQFPLRQHFTKIGVLAAVVQYSIYIRQCCNFS